MRPIKLRAWNSDKAVLANVSEIEFDTNRIIVYGDHFVWDLHKDTLEQYTGVDDADGGPIYEGDILQDVNDGIIVGAVTYDDKEGMYECNKNCMYDVSDCKVVGNIHENPELLEAD